MEGYTLRQLAIQSGYSISTLRRLIKYWLERPPSLEKDLSWSSHLILDGTILQKGRGIFAVMDASNFCVVYGAYDMLVRLWRSGVTKVL